MYQYPCRGYCNNSRISGMGETDEWITQKQRQRNMCPEITRSGGCARARSNNYSKASSALRRTRRRTFFLYASIGHVRCEGQREIKGRCVPAKSDRISFAASTFAGLSKFGFSEDRREITLSNCDRERMKLGKQVRISMSRLTMDSTVCTGIHRSPASS